LRLYKMDRPRNRNQCRDGLRPCPWVGCRYHLYLEVLSAGHIAINHDCEPWELEETCALDIADRGPHIFRAVGRLIGVSKQRAEQIIAATATRLRRRYRAAGITSSVAHRQGHHLAVAADCYSDPDLHGVSKSIRDAPEISTWRPRRIQPQDYRRRTAPIDPADLDLGRPLRRKG
jgi:hypothetical protein